MVTSTLPLNEPDTEEGMSCSFGVLEKFPDADMNEVRYWFATLCSRGGTDLRKATQISVSPGAPWAVRVRE